MKNVYIVWFDNGNMREPLQYIVAVYASLEAAEKRKLEELSTLPDEVVEEYHPWVPYSIITQELLS